MAASDHLAPKLFHGTTAAIAPGDVIRPGTRDAYYDSPVGAYATTEVTAARHFAREAEATNLRKDIVNDIPHQRSLFVPIYEVEHVSQNSDPKNRLRPHMRRDMEGFTVKGVHHYMNYDEDPLYPEHND